MIETISGIIIGLVVIVLSRILSKFFTNRLIAATILVAIAFIYVGFSLKENPLGFILLEVMVSLAFYFIAIIGYTRNNSLIAYGILMHGCWDILHHNGTVVGTNIPVYYPPFCLIVDIIDGLYFLYIFKKQS
jgi:vacuolar-type H+-ATPase subunit I/STV1